MNMNEMNVEMKMNFKEYEYEKDMRMMINNEDEYLRIDGLS